MLITRFFFSNSTPNVHYIMQHENCPATQHTHTQYNLSVCVGVRFSLPHCAAAWTDTILCVAMSVRMHPCGNALLFYCEGNCIDADYTKGFRVFYSRNIIGGCWGLIKYGKWTEPEMHRKFILNKS